MSLGDYVEPCRKDLDRWQEKYSRKWLDRALYLALMNNLDPKLAIRALEVKDMEDDLKRRS